MMTIINISKTHKLLIVSLILSLSGYLTPVKATQDDSFGRLFSRPAERNNLDNLRQNQKLKTVIPQPDIDESANVAPVSTDPVTLQGYVKRSDGVKSTLWINNQAVQEGGTVDNVQVGNLNKRNNAKGTQTSEALELKMPSNGKRIRLKAGQVYEPDTNQIKELRTVEKERQLNLEETGVIDGNDERDLK